MKQKTLTLGKTCRTDVKWKFEREQNFVVVPQMRKCEEGVEKKQNEKVKTAHKKHRNKYTYPSYKPLSALGEKDVSLS